MKKYILVILAVLIMATILMADSKGKVTTDKDLKTGLYTVKVDGKIVLQTKDKEKVIQFLTDPWGWPPENNQYDGFHYETYPDGHIHIVVDCHLFALRNDCADHAARIL